MRISILAVGRSKPGPERTLCDLYLQRCRDNGRALGLQNIDLREIAVSGKPTAKLRRLEEAKNIISALPQDISLIVLDERGDVQTSEKFAARLARIRDLGSSSLVYLIGGPDGLDEELRNRAEQVLSFSPLTWPHQLVRVMLVEQIYRATTILLGHPYHRGQM